MEDKGNMNEIQYKAHAASIERKEAGEDGVLHIKAYALAFGNVDSWGDIIAPGACDKFLASEDYKRMALCYQHNISEVVGVITDAGVDEKGMWIEADVLPTTTGKDVQTLIKAGAIKEFSIGYYANEYHFEKVDGYAYDIRVLDAITIVEVSPVTRAANPQAVLIDAKNEGAEQAAEVKDEVQEDAPEIKEENHLISENMENMEMKQALETAQAELKATRETAEKQAQEINNLDASIKAQQEVINDLKASIKEKKEMTFADALKAALEENRDKIEKMFEEKRGGSSVRMEVKLGAAGVGASAYGTAVDTLVGSQPHTARAFLTAFGEEVVAGDKAAWLDGSYTNNADYVEELAAATDSEAGASEVIRQFGKIATRLLLSSELNDWMGEIYNWAQNEAVEFINDKVDSEVWNGAGNDTNAKKKIYGIKTQSTAFAKVGTYADANVGDVILDAVAQAKRNGFVANVAICSFATEAELKGLKDNNGNYIYNQLTGVFGPVRILPSTAVGEKEILVADSRCAKVLRRPSIEVEITRDADLDGWKVNVRKSAQTKVKTGHKGGLIYIADKATAITAITK
jgi:HK97 family phage prohead protease/HK97 family phage major capsid protein